MNKEKWSDDDLRILIIDELLSKGWVSLLDMYIAVNKKFERISRKGKSPMKFYKDLFSTYGYKNIIKSRDIPHLVDVWALVRRGVDIENAIEFNKKEAHNTNIHLKDSPTREEFKRMFIDIEKLSPNECDEKLAKYNLSDDTLRYLREGGTNGQSIVVYRYKNTNYSIVPDLIIYNEKLRDEAQKFHKIMPGVDYDIKDAERFDLIPDPDVIARKVKLLKIKAIQDELVRDATGSVKRRLEIIDQLKKTRPLGWRASVSETYLNAIYDGRGVLDDIDLAPIIHKYGSYLIDIKEYSRGNSFLKESLSALKKSMSTGSDKDKEEYALILQNLSALHINLCNYILAEEEAIESLNIFRCLSQESDLYQYGVAALLYTLAGIHVKMRKFDTVEEEYEEAVRIFSPLSESEPTKYLYMLVDGITSLASYYNLVGRPELSIKAYSRAMPYLEKLTEKNFEDFAPQKIVAMINFSSVFQDMGEYDEAESILLTTLPMIQRLEVECPGVFKEEESTVLNNLGVLYLTKGEYDQAKKHLKEAECIRRYLVGLDKFAFNCRLATTLDSEAKLNHTLGDLNGAIEKWNEALSLMDIYDENSEAEWLSKVGEYNFNIGAIYLKMCDVVNASLYLEKAESTFRKIFDKKSFPKMFEDSFATTLMCLGELYDCIDERKADAEKYFKESIDIALWYISHINNTDYSFLVKIYFDYGFYLFEKERYEEAKHIWMQTVKYGESGKCKSDTTSNIKELVDTARQGINNIEDIPKSQENVEYYNGELKADIIMQLQCTPEEARYQLHSIMQQISQLKQTDSKYRQECRMLYSNALKYGMALEKDVLWADFLSSFCKYLADGYEFQPIEHLSSIAFDIYTEALKKDIYNMGMRLKYIHLLSVYCQCLVENNRYEKYETILISSMDLLVPKEINTQDDIDCTYAALKNEILYDYFVNASPDEIYEISQRVLYFYRFVSKPEQSMMCRFLIKAAEAACYKNEWEQAEQFINEAESVIQGCDINDFTNRLRMGELYTLKGRYIHLTPLKWPNNYVTYSKEKAMDAFNKAQSVLEGGVDYNPALFKCKLLELYRYKLNFVKADFVLGNQQVLDTSQTMIQLINELYDINQNVFCWRSVEAHLEVVEALEELYFLTFYRQDCTLEQLENCCLYMMSEYENMVSKIEIYKTKDPDLFVNLTSKIFDSRKKLEKDLHDAQK